MAHRVALSKSRLLSFLQCPKRLWLEQHKPEEAVVDDAAQFIFAQGHEVGRVARSLFPGGRLIEHDAELSRALAETEECVGARRRVPVFEATFQHRGALVRVDVLEPDGRAGWHLREVKSAGEVKDYHLDDVAIQRWVVGGSGLRLSRQSLVHIDTAWTYVGDGDYGGLLAAEDLTAAAAELEGDVPRWVAEARRVLAEDEPEVPMGEQCTDPYDCPFQGYCERGLETVEFPVTLLPNNGGKALAAGLIDEGYVDLREVPAGRIDHPLYSRIHRVTRSGRRHLDAEAREWLDGLPWPRAYLDFETINLAVPRWAGTRPYEQVAFQWSCHVETRSGGLDHAEFLDLTGGDPRRPFAESLVAALRGARVVLAYNAPFERGCLLRLAEAFPDLADELGAIAGRLADLLAAVRRHYYHRDMMGRFSLKAVLPTVLGRDPYADLEGLRGGALAQAAYYETLQPGTDAARRREIGRQLREYCRLDTWALVALARFLGGRPLPALPPASRH